MHAENRPKSSLSTRRRLTSGALAVTVLCVGLAITLVIWRSLAAQAERVAGARFELVVADTMTRLDQRIEAYAQILRGGAGLARTRPDLDRTAWADYYRTLDIDRRFPGVQTFLWVPRLPADPTGIAETERRLRARGHADFRVWARDNARPATTIAFVEPFAGVNRKALGFDMFSEPVRRLAMERARDTGDVAISSKLSLVIDDQPLPGFIMYVPVFRGGTPPDSVEARRETLIGYVASAFRVSDLLKGTLRGHADKVRIRVYDADSADSLAIMYDSARTSPDAVATHAAFDRTVDFPIGGHRWTVQMTAGPDFDSPLFDSQTVALLAAGVLLSLLAAWTASLALSLRRRSDQLSRLTGELRSHQTELEAANAAMSQARDAALAAARAKSEFLANMSHEIRTPIHGFLGHTELALGNPLDPETRGYLETAQSCGHSLLHVVNDILDFSKLEAGKLELECIGFDLRTLLLQCVRTVSIPAQEKGLSLIWSADETLPDRWLGDPNRLRQVLLNLLSNAVKFTTSGEVELCAEPETEPDGPTRLRFSVRDTGIGMNPQTRDRLFEAFFQADASITRQYGGTGLGLAISARIVRLMGGKLEVDSTSGEGSRFHFALPLAADAGEARSAPRRDCRIAIVDPSERRAGALQRLLRFQGFEASVHATPESAEGGDAPVWILDASAIPRAAWTRPAGRPGHRLTLLLGPPALTKTAPEGIAVRRYPVDPRDLAELISRPASTAAAPERRAPPAASPSGPALRILVAEDNPVNRALIERMLVRLGQTATLVNDGAAAAAAVAMQDFDLVLMDLQMPVLDGLEATRVIRTTERELGRSRVPIHALTADILPGDRQRCTDAGMDGHLAKPLSLADLQKLLESLRPGEFAKAS
jgi:signal transduction histidine kinase/CheY-like chemotaxis protein